MAIFSFFVKKTLITSPLLKFPPTSTTPAGKRLLLFFTAFEAPSSILIKPEECK